MKVIIAGGRKESVVNEILRARGLESTCVSKVNYDGRQKGTPSWGVPPPPPVQRTDF